MSSSIFHVFSVLVFTPLWKGFQCVLTIHALESSKGHIKRGSHCPKNVPIMS
uniref:Uncharacterized protein n=1 Tax=Anguilla anguilla TaxID=7936 RepID=A0A0E9SBY6_ANGAN